MQHQARLPVPSGSGDRPIGISAYLTQPELQTDTFKELVNKLAWAIGSTYKLSFSKRYSHVRVLAVDLARQLITDQGYPVKISK